MKIQDGCRVQIQHGSYNLPVGLVANVDKVIDKFKVRVEHNHVYQEMAITGVRLIDSSGRLV